MLKFSEERWILLTVKIIEKLQQFSASKARKLDKRPSVVSDDVNPLWLLVSSFIGSVLVIMEISSSARD